MNLVLVKKKTSVNRSEESRMGWALASPALLLIATFVVLPIVLGFGLSFTNAQLLSPTSPEFTGLSNFRTLLGVTTTTLNAERNPDGSFSTDSQGNIVYENLRVKTRQSDKYPNLVGKSEVRRYGEDKKMEQ